MMYVGQWANIFPSSVWSRFDVYDVTREHLCENTPDYQKDKLKQLAARQHGNANPQSQLPSDVCNEVYPLEKKKKKNNK